MKLDATSDTDATLVVQQLQREYNIVHVDIVFANAGVGYAIPKVSELKISDSKAHFETNVYGILRLYQAFLPLLKRSPNHPKWVSMGSSSRRLNDFLEWPNAAYGATKVFLHWMTRAMHSEEPELIALVLDPG